MQLFVFGSQGLQFLIYLFRLLQLLSVFGLQRFMLLHLCVQLFLQLIIQLYLQLKLFLLLRQITPQLLCQFGLRLQLNNAGFLCGKPLLEHIPLALRGDLPFFERSALFYQRPAKLFCRLAFAAQLG